jgi:hypothetical protein
MVYKCLRFSGNYMYFSFLQYQGWSPGFLHARQALYYLSQASSLFNISYFFNRVSSFSLVLALDLDPRTSASLTAGIIECTTTYGLLIEIGVLLTFCPGWLQTKILQISSSPVAGTTDVCYHALSVGITEAESDLFGKLVWDKCVSNQVT